MADKRSGECGSACGRGSRSAWRLAGRRDDRRRRVYSEAQSARGEALSTKSCAVCHGDQLKGTNLAPVLRGSDFLKAWVGKTASDLSDRIDTTMPANEPGTLSAIRIAPAK